MRGMKKLKWKTTGIQFCLQTFCIFVFCISSRAWNTSMLSELFQVGFLSRSIIANSILTPTAEHGSIDETLFSEMYHYLKWFHVCWRSPLDLRQSRSANSLCQAQGWKFRNWKNYGTSNFNFPKFNHSLLQPGLMFLIPLTPLFATTDIISLVMRCFFFTKELLSLRRVSRRWRVQLRAFPPFAEMSKRYWQKEVTQKRTWICCEVLFSIGSPDICQRGTYAASAVVPTSQ